VVAVSFTEQFIEQAGAISESGPKSGVVLRSHVEARSSSDDSAQRMTKSPPSSSAQSSAKSQDRDLVDRARQGDMAAFGELVRKHQPRIFRLAAHMLRDRSEAEDVAQETFIRAYQALARFDGRSEPYTWFYRIAVNLSLNHIRSRKSSRMVQHDERNDVRMQAFLVERRPSALADPPGDASRKELYGVLCEAIDALSDTLRTTLILVCVDGLSHEEAASVLGAPEGTIAWRVHEARRKMREFLLERGFDLEGEVA
jgi:RNA polymerase sigma-70 factor (ECF subfamily)